MKENTIPQVAVSAATNPEQLQKKMNAELLKHTERSCKTKDVRTPNNTKVIYDDFGIDSVDGFVVETSPDHYIIGINTRKTEEEQLKALKHEIYHIEHGHFGKLYRGKQVTEIELETHKEIGY